MTEAARRIGRSMARPRVGSGYGPRPRRPARHGSLRRGIVAAAAVVCALLALVPGLGPDRAAAQSPEPAAETVTMQFFHGFECTHCADERPFLAGLKGRHPGLVIEEIECWHNAENRALLKALAEERGFKATSTPVTIIGERHWVGFDGTIAREIEESVAAAFAGEELGAIQRTSLELPFLGEIDLAGSSLVVSALVIGFVDGVNPCSLWVLSVLLAMVLHSGSRGRVLAVGTTFLFVTTAMYGLYMTGMYSALDYVGQLSWIRLAVAAVALVFGLIHMKDFIWFKQGPSLSIDDAHKPGIYKRMRDIASADRSTAGVLGGTVALAVGVSLLETPCTAGLPLLWTSLLASQGVPLGTALVLFAIYMLVFLLDELALFAAAVATMRAARMQEQHGRFLKLLSGTVMVTLAVAMVLLPASLESVSGTVGVFGFAVVLVAAIWSVHRLLSGVRARRSASSDS